MSEPGRVSSPWVCPCGWEAEGVLRYEAGLMEDAWRRHTRDCPASKEERVSPWSVCPKDGCERLVPPDGTPHEPPCVGRDMRPLTESEESLTVCNGDCDFGSYESPTGRRCSMCAKLVRGDV